MASAIPRLSQSKSKQEFFERLGWTENDDGCKRLYQTMMEEAAAGRSRTVQDRNNLTLQSRNDPRVGEGPYSSAMITETARYREIQSIYHAASPETRWWYDRGVTSDSGWDNWIIRWCLWHVFRYRDDRNRNRRSPQRNTTPPGWQVQPTSPTYYLPTSSGWSSPTTQPVQYGTSSATSAGPASSDDGSEETTVHRRVVRPRYDPVHDRTIYETINYP